MFWTIFTILMVLSIAAIVVGINNYKYEGFIGVGIVVGLFTLFIMLGPLACETESKVSDKQKVCFRQPFPTPQAIYIYTNDGAELKGNSMEDAYFPFGQAKCYKREHYNHYGNVIKTSYTFKTKGDCKRSRTYYIKR